MASRTDLHARKRPSRRAPLGSLEPTQQPASSIPGLPGRYHLLRTADEFRQAAIHIFGAHGWMADTCRCLGVNESTCWRWVNEQVEIKPYALAVMSAWLRVFLLTGERPPEVGPDA